MVSIFTLKIHLQKCVNKRLFQEELWFLKRTIITKLKPTNVPRLAKSMTPSEYWPTHTIPLFSHRELRMNKPIKKDLDISTVI